MSWVSDQVEDAVDFIVEDIPEAIEDVIIDPVDDFLGGVEDAIKGAVDFVDDAIQNPFVRAVASVVAPQFAPYLNAYATLDSGEDLSAMQLASLGLSSVADLSTVEIDPAIAEAVKTGARIADGADPLDTLIGVYGADFVDALGLEAKIDSSLSSIFGEETAQFLEERMDLRQLGADLVAGTDLNRTVANQFGDDIANYLSSDNPALGYAGIETFIALDNGEEFDDALAIGAREYYDRDGKLPELDAIAGAVGYEGTDYNFDWDKYLGDINLDFEGLKDLYGSLSNINIPDTGFLDAVGNLAGGAYDQIAGFFDGMSLPEIQGMGVDIGNIDFSGVNFGDINWGDYDFGDFEGVNWEGMDFSGTDLFELQDMGINIGDFGDLGIDWKELQLGDISFPDFMLIAAKKEEEAEEELEENKLLQPDLPDIVDPRQVNIASTPAPAIAQPFKNPLLG